MFRGGLFRKFLPVYISWKHADNGRRYRYTRCLLSLHVLDKHGYIYIFLISVYKLLWLYICVFLLLLTIFLPTQLLHVHLKTLSTAEENPPFKGRKILLNSNFFFAFVTYSSLKTFK